MWTGMESVMNGGGWGMGMMGAGMIGVALFWVLVIASIVVLVRWLVGWSRSATPAKTALDFLLERYARGEIDRSEFEQKKRDLGR